MIEGLDYTLAYNEFLLKESFKQQHMLNCINEAVAISEGVNPELRVFNEAISDTIKEAWNKFITFIHKIFAKFRATFEAIFTKDKAYMEKYAGIITRQPLKISVSVTNYNLQLMANTHAEIFNPDKIEAYKGGLQTTLAASMLPPAIKNFKGSVENDFKEYVANQFCGGDVDGTIDEKAINMTDLYNYCHDFMDKKVKDLLKKDEDNVSKSAEHFNKIATQIDHEAKAAAEAKQEEEEAKKITKIQSDGNGNGGSKVTTDDTLKTENGNKQEVNGEAYISLDKSFKSLSEKVDVSGGNGSSKDDNRLGPNGGAPSVTDAQRYAKQANGTTGEKSSDDQMSAGIKSSGITLEDANKAFASYKAIHGVICSQKLTYSHAAYDDYIKIIHAHVSSYVGEKDTNSQMAAAGTNYSNSNNANNQQQQQGNGEQTQGNAQK